MCPTVTLLQARKLHIQLKEQHVPSYLESEFTNQIITQGKNGLYVH